MKALILSCAIIVRLALGALNAVYADSATWNLNPTSGDWNTAANWTPNTVPNGPADVATFDLSNTTEISLLANTEVNGVVFNPGAIAFNITTPPDVTFTVSGAGITNNSGVTQTFIVTTTAQLRNAGLIVFSNNATAGSGTIFTLSGGTLDLGAQVQFFGTSTAGNGTFNLSGATVFSAAGSSVLFFNSSTAGNGIFTSNSGTANGAPGGGFAFRGSSSAGNGVFTLHGGALPGTGGGSMYFFDSASAGSGVFTLDGAMVHGAQASAMVFENLATAEDANITVNSGAVRDADGAAVIFFGRTAGNATFTVNGGRPGKGGRVDFEGDALGGTAHLKLFGNGFLTISNSTPPGATIGSLEGDGRVVLGANNLAVGANNGSTLFSGVIRDKDQFGRTGGSFSKVGTGMLTLTGANLYPGGTTISDGTLVISNTSGSGTGTGTVQVDAGTLGGTGIIAGVTTIGTGSGTGAFLAPAAGTNVQATLTIQSALTFNADATYTYTFKKNRNGTRTDQVIANGVTINSGAMIALSGQTRAALRQGRVLTLISNTSANPISGTFANLPDGGIVTINGNNLKASYSGGDGNDLTLTVVP